MLAWFDRFFDVAASAAAIYGWTADQLDRFRANCIEVAKDLPLSAEDIATGLIAERGHMAAILSVDEIRNWARLEVATGPVRQSRTL